MPGIVHRSLHVIGFLVAIAGVIFVAWRLNDYAGHIDISQFGTASYWIIAALATAYGAANVFLALAWWYLLKYCGVHTTFNWSFKAYGISQLAKYVPGNIFHFAGRQAFGVAAGLPGKKLAKSMAWELGLIAGAATLFGVFGLRLVHPFFAPWVLLSGFGVLLGIALCATWRLISANVAKAAALQALFLTGSGLVFAGTLIIVLPAEITQPIPVSMACGTFVIAWVAGLITPGAPAGLGVREFVLLFLLQGSIPEASLLLAVVLNRLIAASGDFAFFLFAFMLKNKLFSYASKY